TAAVERPGTRANKFRSTPHPRPDPTSPTTACGSKSLLAAVAEGTHRGSLATRPSCNHHADGFGACHERHSNHVSDPARSPSRCDPLRTHTRAQGSGRKSP